MALGLLAGLLVAKPLAPPPLPVFRATIDVALAEGPWTLRPTDSGAAGLVVIEERRALELVLPSAGAGELSAGESVSAYWVGATDILRIGATATSRERVRALVQTAADRYGEAVAERHREELASLQQWAGRLARDAEAAEQRFLAVRSDALGLTPALVRDAEARVAALRTREPILVRRIAEQELQVEAAAAAHRDLLYREAAGILGEQPLERRTARLRDSRDPKTLAAEIRAIDAALFEAVRRLQADLAVLRRERLVLARLSASADRWLERTRSRLVEFDRIARETGRLRGLADVAAARLADRTAELQASAPRPGPVALGGPFQPAAGAPMMPLLLGGLLGVAVALAGTVALSAALARRRSPTVARGQSAPTPFVVPDPVPRRQPIGEPALLPGALGSLPPPPVSALDDLADYLSRNAVSRLAVAAQALAIAHRQSLGQRKIRLTLVVPGSEGLGAATAAMALAHVAAAAGERAVMLDCSAPRVAPPSRAASEPVGLSALLAGERDYHEILRIEPKSGLHWLPGGPDAARLAEQLTEARFVELVQILKRTYDEIYLHAPLSVVAALAPLADALLFVADGRDGKAAELREGLIELAEKRDLPFGLVLVDRSPIARPAPVVSPPIPEFDFNATRIGRMREAAAGSR